MAETQNAVHLAHGPICRSADLHVLNTLQRHQCEQGEDAIHFFSLRVPHCNAIRSFIILDVLRVYPIPGSTVYVIHGRRIYHSHLLTILAEGGSF